MRRLFFKRPRNLAPCTRNPYHETAPVPAPRKPEAKKFPKGFVEWKN